MGKLYLYSVTWLATVTGSKTVSLFLFAKCIGWVAMARCNCGPLQFNAIYSRPIADLTVSRYSEHLCERVQCNTMHAPLGVDSDFETHSLFTEANGGHLAVSSLCGRTS